MPHIGPTPYPWRRSRLRRSEDSLELPLVLPTVQEGDQLENPLHGLVGTVEGQQVHRGRETLLGDGLRAGELAQPVGAVDAAEAGLAHPAERQRRDGREGE